MEFSDKMHTVSGKHLQYELAQFRKVQVQTFINNSTYFSLNQVNISNNTFLKS